MTLDEAIRHCEEVAERYETRAKMIDRRKLGFALDNPTACHECASDHRQLAEWLTELKGLREENIALKNHNERLRDCVDNCVRNGELDFAELKEAKRLLKAAVEDIRHCMHYYDPCEVCSLLDKDGECPVTDDDDCKEKYKWLYEDEALALIGEDTNVPATADDIIVGRRLYGWISCEERLPEDNTTVLYVWRSENGNVSVFHGWHGSIRGLGGAWHQSGVGMQRPEDEVTHWMPLPEPPKE